MKWLLKVDFYLIYFLKLDQDRDMFLSFSLCIYVYTFMRVNNVAGVISIGVIRERLGVFLGFYWQFRYGNFMVIRYL